MRLRPLGKSGIQITPILMGTWQADKNMWSGIDDQEISRALKIAYDQGITTFDTAAVYGNGYSEKMIKKAFSEIRDKIVYATKTFPHKLRYQQVIHFCDKSLKNLGTDYIDLYQIHWPSSSFQGEKVPIEETMKAMNHLKQQGKIRAIGVSNFSLSELEEVFQYGQIDSLQPPYSLFWRHVEKDIVSFCQENEVTILAYSPLAQGMLTGKFGPNHQFPKGDHRAKNKLFRPEHTQRIQKALEQLRLLAEEKNVTLGQLSLAWVITQSQTSAIAGARNQEQVRQNIVAAEISLSKEDLKTMDAIGRSVTDFLDDNPILWK